jgi:hypothetical protein
MCYRLQGKNRGQEMELLKQREADEMLVALCVYR